MPARQFTAEELIALVRKNGGYTNVDSEGTTDEDLLDYLNEEMLGLYADVATSHEEYFVVVQRIPTVASTSKYLIPHRAMFSKIRNILGVTSDGSWYQIEQMSRENVPGFGVAKSYSGQFYLEANHIVLHPAPTTAEGSLDVAFLFRPGELVPSTDCRQIVTVNPSTGAVTVDSNIPTTWGTTITSYDIHGQYSGSGIKAWEITTTTNPSTTSMAFTPADIDGSTVGRFPVAIGDWICEEEMAALPGLPRELHPLIAQAVCLRIAEKRDPDNYKVMEREFEKAMDLQRRVLAMRVEGPGPKITLSESTFLGR